MEKFENQCSSIEHGMIMLRQPVETLEDGCNMSIPSMISGNMCKSTLNTL